MPEDQPGDRPPFGVEKVSDEKRAASIRSALHELHNVERPVSPDIPLASTERAIGRLTIAVWAVAILLAFHAMLAVLNLTTSQSVRATIPAGWTLPGAGPPTITEDNISSSRYASEKEFNGFPDWPLDRQIKAATVIAIVKYVKDGDRHKAVFSEFLKKDPGLNFYYKVGDEWERGGFYAREGVSRGDGQIVFFTGNPPFMKYGCSMHGTRILSFGDMPLETLRERAIAIGNSAPTNSTRQ
jgi:hypothetical protein